MQEIVRTERLSLQGGFNDFRTLFPSISSSSLPSRCRSGRFRWTLSLRRDLLRAIAAQQRALLQSSAEDGAPLLGSTW